MTTYEYLLQKYGTTLTFEQAAKELGIPPTDNRVMCARGDIPAIKLKSREALFYSLSSKHFPQLLRSFSTLLTSSCV